VGGALMRYGNQRYNDWQRENILLQCFARENGFPGRERERERERGGVHPQVVFFLVFVFAVLVQCKRNCTISYQHTCRWSTSVVHGVG